MEKFVGWRETSVDVSTTSQRRADGFRGFLDVECGLRGSAGSTVAGAEGSIGGGEHCDSPHHCSPASWGRIGERGGEQTVPRTAANCSQLFGL